MLNINARVSQQHPFLGTRKPLQKETPEERLILICKRKHFEVFFLKSQKPLDFINLSLSLLLENKDNF